MQIDYEHLERILPRYLTAGPRYTSYPTAPSWSEAFDATEFRAELARERPAGLPLSLYVHVPFCRSLCHFCACNRIVTRDPALPERYLDSLFVELEAVQSLVGSDRPVTQLHWGGGTPTHLDAQQIHRLGSRLREAFAVADDAEISLEVDPRVTREDQLAALRECGFDRLSLGVQDFEPRVQEAVHRIQPPEMVAELVETARARGFRGVSFDLIYGLPFQSEDSFDRTLDLVLSMRPDRIALYAYAHVTWVAKQQRGFERVDLPDPSTRLRIFLRALRRLVERGYVYVGMDHFALADDPLARALGDGTLRRNFMGYTTQQGTELVGLGPSAISELGDAYAQSHRGLEAWAESLRGEGLATLRGHCMSREDQMRRWVIQSIMCGGSVDAARFEQAFGAAFDQHFAPELHGLAAFEEDALIERADDGGFALTPAGRVLMRNVAMLFDAYLPQQQKDGGSLFSKTV